MQAKAIFVLVSALALSIAGCKKEDPKPTPPPVSVSTAVTAQPSASASAATTATPSATASSSLPIPWEKAIKEGKAYDDTWTSSYSIYRKSGGIGMSITEAYSYCEGHGKALCSETQYRRACAEEPELGKIETWTASGDPSADQIAVVGGEECTSKQYVATTDKKPGRATLCCDRAVGVRTQFKSADFLVATHRHMGSYEKALKARDPLALQDLYNDKVIFENKVWERDKLLELHKKYWKKVPQQWTQFDYCRVDLHKGKDAQGEDDNQFETDCAALFRVGPEVHFAMQRVTKGRSGKNAVGIIFIGDVGSATGASGIDMKAAIAKGSLSGDADGGAAPADSASSAAGGPGKEKKVRVGVLMIVD